MSATKTRPLRRDAKTLREVEELLEGALGALDYKTHQPNIDSDCRSGGTGQPSAHWAIGYCKGEIKQALRLLRGAS